MRTIARHALPRVIEASILPGLVVFTALELAGNETAVLAGLAWLYLALYRRVRSGQKLPALLVLSTITMTGRSIVTLVVGSMFVYVLQPTLSATLVAGLFIASVAVGQPLAARLAQDFCPFADDLADHPHIRRLFRNISLLWACVNVANTAITIWLLVSHSVATVIIARAVLGPTLNVIGLAVATWWFRAMMRQRGITVVKADRRAVRLIAD